MEVVVGNAVGAEVIGGVLVGLSRHPQMSPGVSQVEVDVVEVGVLELVVVVVGSRQPSHPGSWQVDVEVAIGLVVVIVGAGVAEGVVVVGSLQPNQPGVLQVDVVVVVVEVVFVVVVVSSRQPHQPGVLQVDVLVEVEVDVVVEVLLVVVLSDPLLRKNFHS